MKTRLIKTTLAALAGVGLIGSIAACGQQVATAEVGACIVTADLPSDMTEIPTVDCTEEHDAQVVGKFDVEEDGDYPGEDALTAEAEERCAAAFEEYVGIAFEESSLKMSYVYPSEETWNQANDREVLCFAQTADGSTVTESWEGAAI